MSSIEHEELKGGLKLEAEKVRDYISFNGSGVEDHSPQAELQSIGVAALWHRIQQNQFAYLADEVGMGKTRQAMGVIATQILMKPSSRIVVICPGKPLQEQWEKEWELFINDCLLVNDGTLKSVIDAKNAMPMALHERLCDFSKSLLLDNDRIHLLRYSSFSVPVGFKGDDDIKSIQKTYISKLKILGMLGLTDDEKVIFNSVNENDENWRSKLTRKLNTQYAKKLSILTQPGYREIDLIVCDEAQYLRHTDNARNTNINASLGSQKCNWLFLSATPLHNGPNDIKSLDHYLCTHTKEPQNCTHKECSNITAKIGGNNGAKPKVDVIDVLDEFLVRRPRQYRDKQQNCYDKVAYRNYSKDEAKVANDAFGSVVTSLVQKRLVNALAGENNKFRQGECSSFESLASSTGIKTYNDRDGNNNEVPEMEDSPPTPDRFAIDELNKSLRNVLSRGNIVDENTVNQLNLPHAKLYHVVDNLAKKCLENGSNHKTLVFVRRLDTVDELIVLLKQRQQAIIDRRIDVWSNLLNSTEMNSANGNFIKGHKEFWSIQDTNLENEEDVDDTENDESAQISIETRAEKLPYFQAIKFKSKPEDIRGMLCSLMSKLLKINDEEKNVYNPLQFLVPNELATHCHDHDWKLFINIVFDKFTKGLEWLFDPLKSNDVLTLKRCILQSMRRSDFLVDLYIMDKFADTNIFSDEYVNKNKQSLTNKLLNTLQYAKLNRFSGEFTELNHYFNNWRIRFQNWCLHFHVIQSKCFKKTESVDAVFSRMSAVIGRSGRLSNKYAVAQFKMPCNPNILICTDVLKEGVDMHLFCDEVIHYGVAWTSGDLEQRIGRVDRVNSLIHRNFLEYDGIKDVPKLNASFPYLSDTLDQHQVIRVINDKVLSDLRMDFGKKENELKEIILEDLLSERVVEKPKQSEVISREFLPSSICLKGELLDKEKFEYVNFLMPDEYINTKEKVSSIIEKHGKSVESDESKKELLSIDYFTLRSLHPIRAIEVTYCKKRSNQLNFAETIDDNLKTKWLYRKIDHKYQWLERYSCLVPLMLPLEKIEQTILELINSVNAIEPTAIVNISYSELFEFDNKWKTLVVSHNDHKDPFQSASQRNQSVIIEKIGKLTLVRSPIMLIEDAGKDLATMIAERNTDLKFGYLNDHQGIVWLCCLVAHPEYYGQYFDQIVKQMSVTADRFQQLYTCDDKEKWNYAAQASLKNHIGDSKNKSELVNLINDNVTIAKEINNWQKSLFLKVINAIGEELIPNQEVKFLVKDLEESMSLKKNGTFRVGMNSEDKFRFRMQSFIDFNADWEEELSTPGESFPMMVWELAINTSNAGIPPQLPLEEFNGLPHRKNSAAWEPIQLESNLQNVKAYSYTQDNNRWLVLYHPASNLDGNFTQCIESWTRVAGMLRSHQTFSKKVAAKELLKFN